MKPRPIDQPRPTDQPRPIDQPITANSAASIDQTRLDRSNPPRSIKPASINQARIGNQPSIIEPPGSEGEVRIEIFGIARNGMAPIFIRRIELIDQPPVTAISRGHLFE
jgi:hypothetical protein